ncbi:MAG: hypothetical protein KBT27_07855 [Prevotellaceae bacterium]|nr:hypothetical protein [Candidatus Faecinaster equi]
MGKYTDAVDDLIIKVMNAKTVLPSEKAFAYKMRLDAMRRLPGRPPKNNLVPVGQNYSREILAIQANESQTQIQRFIRLTNLVPELLEMVDNDTMKMRPAVELSYLDEDAQRDLVDAIDDNVCTPSHAQAIRMRKLFEEGNLTREVINVIMGEEKPNQKEKIVLRGERVNSLIPKDISIGQREDYICEALEHYAEYLKEKRLARKHKDRDAR